MGRTTMVLLTAPSLVENASCGTPPVHTTIPILLQTISQTSRCRRPLTIVGTPTKRRRAGSDPGVLLLIQL